MVGLNHRILLALVERRAGKEAVARVLERAGVPVGQLFAIHLTYDDAEWRRLFEAALETLGLTLEQGEAAYADAFLEDALERWPMWFKISRNSREFLIRQPAIHNSVGAGVRDTLSRRSITDKFRIEELPDGIVVHYRSENRHCGLYKALAARLFAYYGDEATIEEEQCARSGAPECVLRVRWARLREAP